MFRGLIKRESKFKTGAVGDKGEAVGLGQIHPAAFEEVLPTGNRNDFNDNLKASALYLKKQHKLATDLGYAGEESWKLAGAAYNGGRGNLIRALQKARKKTPGRNPSFGEISEYLDPRAVDYANSIGPLSEPGLQTLEARARKFGEIRRDDDITFGLIGDKIKKGAKAIYSNVTDPALLKDVAATTAQGVNELVQLWGFIQDKIGNPFGKRVQALGKENVGILEEFITPETRRAKIEPVLRSTGPGTFDLEINPETSMRGIFFKTLKAIPSSVFSIGSGAILNRLALEAAKKAGLAVGTKTATVIAGGSFGFGEGVIEGGFSAMQVAEMVLGADEATLRRSHLYQSLLAQGDSPQDARNKLADTLSSKAGFKSGLISAALGAPLGIFFGKLLAGKTGSSLAGDIIKGAIGESLQEGAQEAASSFIEAKTVQEAGFQTDPLKAGLQGGAEGVVIGPLLGGGGTLALRSAGQGQRTQPEIPAPIIEPFTGQTAIPQAQPRTPSTVETPAAVPAQPQPTGPGDIQIPPFGPRQVPTVETPTTIPGQPVKAAIGRKANLKTVTQDRPITYKLMEAEDLITSHDPESFAPNPNYPKGVQERQYHTDRQAQGRIIDQTQNFDPTFIFTDDPTPANGPPIITGTGIVLGGNSRAMTIKRVLKDKSSAGNYLEALRKALPSFGIEPVETARFKNPVLVRELQTVPQDQAQLRILANDLNRGFTAGLSAFEGAVSAGQRISQETIDFIGNELVGIGEKATLRQLLTKRPTEIINRLLQDSALTQRELPGLFDRNRGFLTEQGKDFIERALVGTVIDDPALLSNLPASVRNKIVTALPSLTRIKSRGGPFNITRDLKAASEAAVDATNRGLNTKMFLSQRGLFGDLELSPRAEILFKSLMNDKPNVFKEKFRKFAAAASQSIAGQTSFLEQKTPEQSFDEIFGKEAPVEMSPSVRNLMKARQKTRVLKQPKPEPGSGNAPEDLQAIKGFEKHESEKASARDRDVDLFVEPITKEKTSKERILNLIEGLYGVTVRGKVTHAMSGASGWRERHSGLIRLRGGRFGSVETLIHETGHSIDNEVEITWPGNNLKKISNNQNSWKVMALPESIRKKAVAELKAMDYEPEKGRMTEGFAEFMRHYVTTERAQEIAPTYFKWFTEEFLKRAVIDDDGRMMLLQPRQRAPKGFKPFKPGFDKLNKEIQIWYEQGSLNRMQSLIDFTGKARENPETKSRRAYKFIMKEFYDSNFIFEEVTQKVQKVTGKEIPPNKDPFELATFYKGKVVSIAETMVRKAMIDPFGKRVGPSLVDALKPAKLKTKRLMEEWTTYAVALRARNNAARGFETGFDEVDLEAVIDQFNDRPGWMEAALNVTEWSNQLMDWYVWSGDLDPGLQQLFRDRNPIYLPFSRIFRDNLTVTKIKGGFEQKAQAIKRTTGSTRPIQHPIEAFIESAAAIVSRSIKTKIAATIADMAEEQGVGGFITKIPPAQHVQQFQVDQIVRQLEEMGADLTEVDPEELINLWYRDANFYGKDNVVALWRKGKLELFEVHPDLYAALKETDARLIPAIKFMAPFARMLRLGATGLNPDFSFFTNPVRDFVWSAVTTKNKLASPLSPLKGALREFTAPENSITDRALNSGLQMATMMGFDRAATSAMYDDLVKRQLGKTGQVLRVVRHPIDTLRRIFQFFELAPRIVELDSYNQIQKEHPEWSPDAVFIRAFNNAQDVTVNFTKSGRTGKQINEITAFFNVALQGPNKLVRAFKENPVRMLWRGFLWVTLPAILFWDENKDKEWYKNIPPEWKYMNMWFEREDGEVVRIPGAHELFLIFGGLPVAALDQEYNKDPKAVEGVMKAMRNLLIPPITPSVVQPFTDVGFNSNWLGNPIEPEWMRDEKTGLPIQDRKFYFTPQLSDEISKAMRAIGFQVSPIQMNHILRQMTGGLYQRGLGIMDTEIQEKHPVLPRAFLRFPNRPTRQLELFYSRRMELQQKKNARKINNPEFVELKRINIFHRTQLKPMQEQIRRLQKNRSLEAIDRINQIYGVMATRFNRFFDPRNRGEFPFAGQDGRLPQRFNVPTLEGAPRIELDQQEFYLEGIR
ncbi:MAG: transglycosylase SLT domain-containing protein [Nitrospinae bacterium]|nr:transglycosylase SLT domain-containing protein [Nitrospinota bacterium]